MDRRLLPVVLALPALALAVVGLFHPHGLNEDTAYRWWSLHVPGLLVFPLVGVALMVLVRGRQDPAAWAVRVAAYLYATVYTALDVVNGITAGYVTSTLAPGAERPDEVRAIFRVGAPMEDVGSWALVVACVVLVFDQVARQGRWALGGVLLLPGAWLVHLDHIFSPRGVLGMVLVGLGTAALAAAQSRAVATGSRSRPVSPITHDGPVTRT